MDLGQPPLQVDPHTNAVVVPAHREGTGWPPHNPCNPHKKKQAEDGNLKMKKALMQVIRSREKPD